MSLPFQSSDSGARLAHYRLMTTIAASGKAATTTLPANDIMDDRVNLSSVANFMNVPVVLAAYQDRNGVETIAADGLDSNCDLARFAVACTELCKNGVIVVPDTHMHSKLGVMTRQWPEFDIRFLVAIPLRNAASKFVGVLAVMDTSKAVAQRGISFRNLVALGDAFTKTGNLQAIIAAK